MSWNPNYATQAANLTALDVVNSAVFEPAVRRAFQAMGKVDVTFRAFPWSGVDLPMVSDLPLSPKDGAEVNLLVGDGVARMVYRHATGKWYQIGDPPLVTTLPTENLVEGLRVVYVAESSSSTLWELAYYPDGSTTYPWAFVGGNVIRAELTNTGVTRNANTYGDPSAGSGPSVTVPLAGDYRVHWHYTAVHDTATGVGYMAIKNGAAATSDANAVIGQSHAANCNWANERFKDFTVTAASTALKAEYRNVSGVGTHTLNGGGADLCAMEVRPRRVG